RRRAFSLLSCFAGGVFLATCLLDLLPDYLASISMARGAVRSGLQFPLQEFILAMGFFLVLVLEQIVLAHKDQSGSLEETRALLGASVQAGTVQALHWPEEPPRPHAHSALRSFLLVASLSPH
uniref:Zinc transporter ZIP1-like n=1 Tax=Pelodiscus sinensis TaxID=13735 RepID=K7G3C1_PELSI